MPIPLEQARAALGDFESSAILNLFAQAHARHVLREVREAPENFPSFDPGLADKVTFSAYAILAAGCSLAEQGDRKGGVSALERAASLLQFIHGPDSVESRESGFHALVASMAFYAAGQYSRAFVGIRRVEQRTLAAGAIAAFLRKDVRVLTERLNEIFLGAEPKLHEQGDLDDWAITLAIARALGASMEFIFAGGANVHGLADAQLRNASIIASTGAHSGWWWVVRLLRLMLGDLGRASPWTVLPAYFGPTGAEQLERYTQVLAFMRRPVSELWASQQAALPLALSSSNRGGVINLRTSAGKTRVAELAILQALISDPKARVLYLAPFRSLALEVEHSLEGTFRWLGYEVSHLYGGGRVSSVDTELASDSAITIATPEKARALLRATPEFFGNVKLVILDEGHLIGRSDRYVRNEVFVDHLRSLVRATGARILLLSAVLPNPQELAQWITGDADAVASSQWKPSAERFGLLRWNGARVRIDWQGEAESFNPSFVVSAPLGFGKRKRPFPQDKNEAVAATAVRLSEIGPVMIFTARANSVPSLAESVLLALGESPPAHIWAEHEWAVFQAVCHEELGPDALELRAARAGVICHSNRLTPQVRLTAERLMRAAPPKIIVATTTLAQGVNVGVSSVIVATPYLNTQTIGKRDFWNICGRAGRAFVDGEGKILYAIDQTRDSWRIKKDEALARRYFEPEVDERVQSGLLSVLVELRKLADRAGVDFEVLLELAAGNDFSCLAENAPRCETLCDLLDDTLLAINEDRLVNPGAEEPAAWVERVFRESLAAIQAKEGTSDVGSDDVISFLRARAQSTLGRVSESARKAVVSSGLPLSVATTTHATLDEFRAVADVYRKSDESRSDLEEAVRAFEKWAGAHGSSIITGAPNPDTLEAVRAGWLGGVGLKKLCDIDESAPEICRQFYGYALPWIIHAASQQLRSLGEMERADALAKIALLVELGVPSELAARVFLAGVLSRAAATELASVGVHIGTTVSQIRKELVRSELAEELRAITTLETSRWLELLATEGQALEGRIPSFQAFVVESDAPVLHARRHEGAGLFLCSADGQTKIPIVATEGRPFDTVANDPRVAFVQQGEEWRIDVRDPRVL